ncbi:MAG: endonuclease NucS [Sedimentisphaerales bacterium]|nr:endonuclease NucS [Sedimentisphaerales bacterium]
MPRYWVIAPVECKPPELFDRVWQFDRANDLISIGWHELGDISRMSRDELDGAVAATYPDKPRQTKALYGNILWTFYHEIKPGDYVVARRGRKILAAVGRVSESAIYKPGGNPAVEHAGFLSVAWQDEPCDKAFSSIVFPMHTLSELSEARFRKLVEDPGMGTEPPKDDTPLEDPSAFVLEKYLEDFIVSNFDTIFKQQLEIYEDTEGNDGQQYSTDIGSIDILSVEPKSNSFVVIELKKGRPSDQVVGQVLRYMGWVKRNLCTEGQSVKGLVICRDPDPKLAYALEMTNNIRVRYYSVSFRLTEVPQHTDRTQ